jgi:hypothetical protein
MVLTRFLTVLLLTNSVSAVRMEADKTELEEDIDNMTESQYKNYLMSE